MPRDSRAGKFRWAIQLIRSRAFGRSQLGKGQLGSVVQLGTCRDSFGVYPFIAREMKEVRDEVHDLELALTRRALPGQVCEQCHPCGLGSDLCG
jgi:hypothetical protein